jgi:two-component system, NtrC family, nitrogen regulation response regulator NtrX
MKPHILLIDDDPLGRIGIRMPLQAAGFSVDEAEDGDIGAAMIRQNGGKYFLAIVDYFMPSGNGPETIKKIRLHDPLVNIVGLSGDDGVEIHNSSLEAGAEAFFVRDDAPEKLVGIVKRIYDNIIRYKPVLESDLESREAIIKSVGMFGCSEHLEKVAKLIGRYAPSNETVLITGENGTGKERVARSLHVRSNRASQPFVPLNMAAIPDHLAENELFGSVRGSYTGSVKDKTGKFIEANGGTIFLDEIGDMKLELQAKLLRVLQEKEVTPIGSTKTFSVNVRVVAATNANLIKNIKSGLFREDLFYRLNVLPIELLPLRQRKEDIDPLVSYFVHRFNEESGSKKVMLRQTVERLKTYNYPGNIRELESIIKRLLTAVDGPKITPHDLDSDERFARIAYEEPITSYSNLEQKLKDSEREFLELAAIDGGSIRDIAARIGMTKSKLDRKLKEFGIVPGSDKIKRNPTGGI